MARTMLRGIARRAEERPSRNDLDDAARREVARPDNASSAVAGGSAASV
jgi:hypothetical protein